VTDGRSVSQSVSLGVGPHLGLMTRYYFYLTITVLLLWGALSDERTGLTFVYAAGPCQRSLSQVRVPWDWLDCCCWSSLYSLGKDHIENTVLYHCITICCCRNMFTTLLPSNGHHLIIWEVIMLVLLMGGIYEIHHWDGIRCHDIRTKSHVDWFRHSEVDVAGYTCSKVIS
jgi:hypothetical protein